MPTLDSLLQFLGSFPVSLLVPNTALEWRLENEAGEANLSLQLGVSPHQLSHPSDGAASVAVPLPCPVTGPHSRGPPGAGGCMEQRRGWEVG